MNSRAFLSAFVLQHLLLLPTSAGPEIPMADQDGDARRDDLAWALDWLLANGQNLDARRLVLELAASSLDDEPTDPEGGSSSLAVGDSRTVEAVLIGLVLDALFDRERRIAASLEDSRFKLEDNVEREAARAWSRAIDSLSSFDAVAVVFTLVSPERTESGLLLERVSRPDRPRLDEMSRSVSRLAPPELREHARVRPRLSSMQEQDVRECFRSLLASRARHERVSSIAASSSDRWPREEWAVSSRRPEPWSI